MKRTLIALFALAALLTAGSALAAGTATVTVSATVQGSCLFDVTAYNLNFGLLDPSLPVPPDVTASTNLLFTCSNGTNWTLDNVAGAQTMTGAGGGNLGYTVNPYTVSGISTGLQTSIALSAIVAAADYTAVAPDVYSDTLTINVNP